MKQRGFTLVEIAISLFIMAILVTSMASPVRTYFTNRAVAATQVTLNEANDAIIGFASSVGWLPCPATAVSNGVEDCAAGADGLLPVATLGLSANGASAKDWWGNPLRYGVHPSYITAASVLATWQTNPLPGLKICSSAAGVTAVACGSAATTLANSAPSVVYSTGINGLAAAGVDEGANLNGDQVYVSRLRADPGAAIGEFDDMLLWTSPYVLFSKMIQAGSLPSTGH